MFPNSLLFFWIVNVCQLLFTFTSLVLFVFVNSKERVSSLSCVFLKKKNILIRWYQITLTFSRIPFSFFRLRMHTINPRAWFIQTCFRDKMFKTIQKIGSFLFGFLFSITYLCTHTHKTKLMKLLQMMSSLERCKHYDDICGKEKKAAANLYLFKSLITSTSILIKTWYLFVVPFWLLYQPWCFSLSTNPFLNRQLFTAIILRGTPNEIGISVWNCLCHLNINFEYFLFRPTI